MMGGTWDGASWLGMSIGMVVWLMLAIVVVWLVVRGLNALERRSGDGAGGPTPDEILRERFARGEIDADEFERRRALLQGK